MIEDSDRRCRVMESIAKFITVGPACHQWKGALNHGGYGVYSVTESPRKRVQYRAHRLVYELEVGLIPDGLTLDHLCRNRACVNPLHLEPVTAAENVRRANAALTHCKWGHAFDHENTAHRLLPGGITRRICRTCVREKALASYHAKKVLKGRTLKTHCLRGHELTEENVVRHGYGRHCKPCARQKYAERRRAA